MAFNSQIEPNLRSEAERILDACENSEVEARLLGGLAIQIALGDDIRPNLTRVAGDIDLITSRSCCTNFETLIADLGWAPDRQFNALNGARRLLFRDPENPEMKIDGFVDSFEMCHKLPLIERFSVHPRLLSPADLLLTKLQIIELNSKDRNDCYALLLGFPIETRDSADVICASWVAELLARDWGLNHTIELNLDRLAKQVMLVDLGDDQVRTIRERINILQDAISAAPKSFTWKLRAKIGERKQWYEKPEEIDRD